MNCTEDPFEVPNDDKGMYDWTGAIGLGVSINKSYGDIVRYWCEKEGWGFPSTGLSEYYAVCQANKMWNLTEVEKCMCEYHLLCKLVNCKKIFCFWFLKLNTLWASVAELLTSNSVG